MKRLLPLLLLLPMPALGWGEPGHRIICQIAFDELDAQARAEVQRLIELDPDFDSFAESCLHADAPERIRALDHFVNIARSQAAITVADCPLAQTCVITAIAKDEAILANPFAPDSAKLLALKLLGHWVGDIHQPLHVSFQDDRGANYIFADIAEPESNLHGAWDYRIISHNLGDDVAAIARQLRVSVSDKQRAAWRYDGPVEWANESYQVTISPSVGYCTWQHGACWYSADNMLLNDGEPWRLVEITDAYLERHGPIVAERLQRAGIRLAAVIERAFMASTVQAY